MARNTQNPRDQLVIATGGHNSGDDPLLIGENQYANGKNVTVRGGRVNSRPRFVKRMDLPAGNYQGAKYFKTQDKLMLMSDGRLHEVRPQYGDTVEFTGFDWDSQARRVWFEDIADDLVMQNGYQYPLAFDGQQVRSLQGVTPIGTCMRFANNRLHLASSGGRKDLRIGDIYQPGVKDSALKFTESTYLFGGGSLTMPDPITSLMEMPVMDTASGQGSMIVGTKRNTISVRTEITQRDLWPSVTGFQNTVLPGIGFSGPLAVCHVNNDLYFRSPSGFRSLRLAVGELDSPGYGGLHQEIPERFYQWGTWDASTVYFNDRVLTTVNPKILNGRYVYDGLVVINFESINRLGQKSPPAFDGYWDGLVFRELISAGEKLSAIVVGTTGDELWELMKDGSEFGGESNLWQYIDTKVFHGGDSASLKNLLRGDVFLSNIRSNIELEVSYKKDSDNGFIPWHTGVITYTDAGGVYDPNPIKSVISRHTLPTPPNGSTSYGFQVRVAWKGQCQVDQVRIETEHISESMYMDNESSTLGEDETSYNTRQIHEPTII